jgi:UDP-N-acetylglucosamine--N-acetylmuramyl-(pentapeptide) pyrophosphoryl-undecaprenol N-acetylglucosamine transferase
MHIVFAGGGTGGHFYPVIAVAEALRARASERHLLDPAMTYIAPTPFDEEALFGAGLTYVSIPAGKMRRYFSLRNVTDVFKTAWGTIRAFFVLLRRPPDVVFSKGGFASVPVVLAAHLLRIPIVVHESDSKPGRATLLAAKYADRIGISFAGAAQYFPKELQDKIALTGTPVRASLLAPLPEGAAQELSLDPSVPTILILGGSLGSERINETVIAALPLLVERCNIIHQTGRSNIAEVEGLAKVTLERSAHASRYHAFAYLSQESMRRAAGTASLIISRAGATAITEISLWHKPAILIPIPEAVSHDQRTNAYAYAHTGGAVVLEEGNLTPNVFASEVTRLTGDSEQLARMAQAGASFANPAAATLIADELLRIALSHQVTATA